MKIPDPVSLVAEGQYCLSCSSNSIERVFEGTRTYYRCRACGVVAERSLVIDNGIKWWVDDDRIYWHESVGVIVVDDKKRILCMLRKIFPFAYTIPAGHLDKDEDPGLAARRELEEETGIRVNTNEILEHIADMDILNDSCRRGSDDHRWHLFRYRVKKTPAVTCSDEASEVRWCTISELQNLNPVTYPLTVILEKFGTSLVE